MAAARVVRRKPVQSQPQGIEHERRGELREDLGRRGAGESTPGISADRDIEYEPEARVFAWIVGNVLRHARPGVEIELEGRAKRVGEIFLRVQDELEAAHRARECGVRETDGQGFAFGAGESDSRHHLDVEVTRRDIEIPERARAEQPCTNQPVA